MVLTVKYFVLSPSSQPVSSQTSRTKLWDRGTGEKEKSREGVNSLPTVKHPGCLPVFGKPASHSAKRRRRF